MSIKIIKELPKQEGKQTEVEVEYNGKHFAVGSEFGIPGLDDGIQEGYLEEDLELKSKGKQTENFVIRVL